MTGYGAVITWQTPVNIADATDVSTQGVAVEAVTWSCWSEVDISAASDPVVNGQTFTMLRGEDYGFNGTHTGQTDFYPSGSGDDYDVLLSSLAYSGTSETLDLAVGQLNVGRTYQIQIWYVDTRGSYDARVMQFGTNGNFSDPVSALGQYVIGEFTADSTSLTLDVISGNIETDDAHMTAYQIRELTDGPINIPAFSPNPPQGAKYVPIDADLSWIYSDSADSQKVYMGTESGNLTEIYDLPITSSGSGSETPAAGAVLWLDASDANSLVLDGDKVTEWNDRTGNGNYAAQDNAANQPDYVAADSSIYGPVVDFGDMVKGSTGEPWMEFKNPDGSDLILNTIRTVFVVMRGGGFILTDDKVNTYHFHRGNSSNEGGDPESIIWESQWAHANILNGQTYLNGQLVDGTVTPLPAAGAVISVAATGNVTASTLAKDRTFRTGGPKYAEILIYDRVLTEQERQDTETYLLNKWYGGRLLTEQVQPVPSPMEYGTRYYWRVDMVRDGEPQTGSEWTFETEPAPFDPNDYNLGFDEIVFIKRRPYTSDHYYTAMNNGTSSGVFQEENGIYIYNMRTQEERPVVTAADFPGGSGTGIIGNFTLSFDATKLVFDYRNASSEAFRIWEVNIDGTGLRQISTAPADEADKVARWGNSRVWCTDDLDPAYLPDGDIIFSSTRSEHVILCGTTFQASTLHRMDPNGLVIEKLTDSPVSEFCPVILDDGRVMYHRWEYIDKGHRTPKCIYTMNPDGSKPQELYSLSDSYYNTGAHMYPKPIPGNESKIVVVSASHYPQGNTLGPIQIIDLTKDNRTTEGLTRITPDVRMGSDQAGWYFSYDGFTVQHKDGVGGPLFTDPFPVSPTRFLVSKKFDWNAHWSTINGHAIYLIDTEGNQVRVYHDPDATTSCWHPTPLAARKVPPQIYSFRSAGLQATNEALCIVTNVYEGMEGVEPGEVKWLRILEAVPRPWDSNRRWSPSVSSNSWKAALWSRVQWGLVPVEADGSAYFTVPADRNIMMQALDEDYQEIQRERTYVNYRPGEIRSCMGCHEGAGRAAPPIATEAPIALTRAPSTLQPQLCDLVENGGDGRPEQVVHYPSDIQPIFNAKCASCHSGASPSGGLNLSATLTTSYTVAYEQLLSKELAGYAIPEFGSITSGKGGGNDNGSFMPPKSMGCYDSVMIQKLSDPGDTHSGRVSDTELMILRRWADTNYQYYGTYYGRHHSAHAADPDFRRRPTFEEAISLTAPDWHD